MPRAAWAASTSSGPVGSLSRRRFPNTMNAIVIVTPPVVTTAVGATAARIAITPLDGPPKLSETGPVPPDPPPSLSARPNRLATVATGAVGQPLPLSLPADPPRITPAMTGLSVGDGEGDASGDSDGVASPEAVWVDDGTVGRRRGPVQPRAGGRVVGRRGGRPLTPWLGVGSGVGSGLGVGCGVGSGFGVGLGVAWAWDPGLGRASG